MKRRYLILQVSKSGWTMFTNDGRSYFHNISRLLMQVKPIESLIFAQELQSKLEAICAETCNDNNYFIVEC